MDLNLYLDEIVILIVNYSVIAMKGCEVEILIRKLMFRLIYLTTQSKNIGIIQNYHDLIMSKSSY